MSAENVNLVRKIFDAYAAGNIEKGVGYADPEIVWNPVDEAPGQGRAAVEEYLVRWETEWEDLRTVPEEFLDAGDRVLVTVYFAGRGRGSGIEVDTRVYEVWTIRDGMAVRMDEFSDRAEALRVAGLSE